MHKVHEKSEEKKIMYFLKYMFALVSSNTDKFEKMIGF